MNRRKNEKDDHKEPLTREAIAEAMRRSGYPLEVRLLDALSAMGVSAIGGQRFAVAPGRSTEVDVVASLHRDVPFEDGGRRRTMRVEILLLIEAKSLESDGALVMLPWNRLGEDALDARRLCWGGAPRMGDLEPELAGKVSRAAAGAFTPINDGATFCVQWSTVRRLKDQKAPYPFAANHDEGFWQGLEGVAQAAAAVARTSFIGIETPDDLRVQIPLSLLVFAGRLYAFDRKREEANEVGRCLLDRTFDTGSRLRRQIVDVVAEAEFDGYVRAAKSVLDNVTSAFVSNVPTLWGAAGEIAYRNLNSYMNAGS
jgi:hypothetical protein